MPSIDKYVEEVNNLKTFDKDELKALIGYLGLAKLKNVIRKCTNATDAYKKLSFCKLSDESKAISSVTKENDEKAELFIDKVLLKTDFKDRDIALTHFVNKLMSKLQKEMQVTDVKKLSQEQMINQISGLTSANDYVKCCLKKLFGISVSKDAIESAKVQLVAESVSKKENKKEKSVSKTSEADAKKIEELRNSNKDLNEKLQDMTSKFSTMKAKYDGLVEELQSLADDLPKKLAKPSKEEVLTEIQEAINHDDKEAMKNIGVALFIYASLKD